MTVPPHIRAALCEAGLHKSLAPVNLFEIQEKELLYNIDDWNDLEFDVALDSGAVVHVCGPGDCPGYSLDESLGSRRGQEFLMGD